MCMADCWCTRLTALAMISRVPLFTEARESCLDRNKQQYWCEMGHCCGDKECCTYYYELWWFWLLWMLIILLSCCCAYQHRRSKQRSHQQERQREINLLAYQGACNYPTPPLDIRLMAACKLPPYEEALARTSQTPPPPYSALHVQTMHSPTVPPYDDPPNPGDEPLEGRTLGAAGCSMGPSELVQNPRDVDRTTRRARFSIPVEITVPTNWHREIEDESSDSADEMPTNGSGGNRIVIDVITGQWTSVSGSGGVHLDGGGGDDDDDDDDEHDDDDDHKKADKRFRHRRLTGDSGIDVCVSEPEEAGASMNEAQSVSRSGSTAAVGHAASDKDSHNNM